MNKSLSCFISSAYGIDTSVIKNILHKNNVKIYDILSSNLEFGNNIKKSIKQQIRQVDFAIFIITENNPNLFYEIGICDGLGKEYLIITNRDINLPFELRNTLYLQSKLENENSLLFPITQYIEKIASKKKYSKKNKALDFMDQESSKVFYDHKTIKLLKNLEKKIQQLRENASGQEISLVIEELFKTLQFNFVENTQGKDNGVDFAFWNNKLATPVIVELKYGTFSHKHFQTFEEQINRYASKSDSKVALLLYLDKSNKRFETTSSFNPLILAFDIEDFIHGLLKSSFEDLILKKRNKSVHGSI